MTKETLLFILNKFSWKMDTPELFGSFHYIAASLSIVLAFLTALSVSRVISNASGSSAAAKHSISDTSSERSSQLLIRVLFVTGLILALMEIFKQLFLYYIVNGERYDWWYFPFQLCSVPMYLCLLLPVTRGRMRNAFLTFMTGYTFLSSLAALIYPQDMLRSYTILTIHGFLWHSILLFISLLIVFSYNQNRAADLSISGFGRATVIFLVLSVLALIINMTTEPLMASGILAHPYAAMFYLNPYHTSPQLFVSTVQEILGIPAGLILYETAIILAGCAATLLFRILCVTKSSNYTDN